MDREASLRLSSGNSRNSPIYPPAPSVFLAAYIPEALYCFMVILCFVFPFFSVHMWLQFVRQSLPAGPGWDSEGPLWGCSGNTMPAIGPLIPHWEHYENCNLYRNSLFQENKYSVPNLMQCIWVLCLGVLGVCIPEWIILNSFRWEGMEELT